MLIAISQKNNKNKYGNLVDSLEKSYFHYFEGFKIKLLVIPNSVANVDYYFNRFPIFGIILSGGNDVDSELYGEIRTEESSFAVDRDNTEKKMLEIAIEKKIPVLGICRGMQFINIYFKGGLVKLNRKTHPIENHGINIVDSKTEDVLGNEVGVNSYHNFGVTEKTLSPNLKAFAVSKDKKVIEGIYHQNHPIAGIQWHPERVSPDKKFNEKLVKMFIDRKLFWEKNKKL